MSLSIYLIKKFFKALVICGGVSYSFFFIFSLIGNLGEKFSFNSILYLSILNTFQIFTYIPSHIFILSFCLLIIHLKSKNELIIIKEYIELKHLLVLVLPIIALFIFTEIKKDEFSNNIEKIKSNLISSKNLVDTKILISSEGNKKKYTIFSGYNDEKEIINQYLSFELLNHKIFKGEISLNLKLLGNNLYSNETTTYEDNNFKLNKTNKILFENFNDYWIKNSNTIVKNKINKLVSSYIIIYSIIFYFLFYFCISMIFLSKKFVNKSINMAKIFLLVTSIFLYYLLIPKIMLNSFQYIFQILSLMIFTLIFFQIKKYE